MRAGSLRHFVTIQHFVETGRNSRNDPEGEWQDLYLMVPCSVMTKSAGEDEGQRQQVSSATIEVTMRWHPNVTADHRIKWGTRIFNIDGLNNVDERNRELILTCKERR